MIFYYFTFSKHELNKLNNNIASLVSSIYIYIYIYEHIEIRSNVTQK
jgi:hypothetical protein